MPHHVGFRDFTIMVGLPCVLALMIMLAGDDIGRLLRYERHAMIEWHAWRVLTAHFVHLNGVHLMLNAGGLCIVWLLAGGLVGPLQWYLAAALSAAAVCLGLYVFSPAVTWYVGLSGVVHGLLCAVAMCRLTVRDWVGAILLLGVALKLVLEQSGHGPVSGSLIGGDVVIDAHLYGVMGGGFAGLLAWLTKSCQAGRGFTR